MVKLNAIPEAGDDIEDYTAALFQAAGYFVEKSLVQRDPADVLELDIVATRYWDVLPSSLLAEVKGGGWGYHDLFKVIGWMRYLGLPSAAFFVKTCDDRDFEAVRLRMAPLNLAVVHFENFDDPAALFATAGFGQIASEMDVAVWRHSYSVERRLAKVLTDRVKSHKGQQGAAAALAYHRLVNDSIFFQETVLGRMHALYDAYKQHPKLSLACAIEAEGGLYDPAVEPTDNALMREAMREGKHPFLQACFYTEHRARLALLKAAVDYCCENPEGISPYDPALVVNDGKIDLYELWLHSLPQSFKDGIAWLVQQPTFRRYALFWQQFLWGWGGFYLDDRAEQEFELMAARCGIPTAEIPVALQAFDRFFPSGGWLVAPGWTCARRVKMMPTYFQGVGVYHRRLLYGWNELYEVKSSGYTGQDMARWNNAAVEFLG